ncbi:MAG TPA: hypothetical protein VD927_20110 [Chryseosolibacter sp.]|nr:hypothetical protein [Chryseosolibacter sp.]
MDYYLPQVEYKDEIHEAKRLVKVAEELVRRSWRRRNLGPRRVIGLQP